MTTNKKIPLVIHAGRHKTGTTYLQRFLGVNRYNLLKKQSLLYPSSGSNNYFHYHHALIKALGEDGNGGELLRDFSEEVEKSEPEAILLSSEYLSRSSIDRAFLRNLKNNLTNYDIRLIFYLRNPSDFLCSRYAEQVKKGIFSHPSGIATINAELDYGQFLERYADVFGNANVRVRSYDEAIQGKGLLEDFAEWIGMSDLSSYEQPVVAANKRLPWNYLRLLWMANRTPFSQNLIGNRLVRKLFTAGASVAPRLFDGRSPIKGTGLEIITENVIKSNKKALENFRGEPGLLKSQLYVG